MKLRESAELATIRRQKLLVLQEHYPTFVPFLRDMMGELGFSTTEIQENVAEYLETGPAYLMIQAQRGEAKTTITAIFAVWCLIHNPKLRILVVSAGETQANEISTLIVRLITSVDTLECLRPDKSMGDRTSVEAFDVHYTLKGVDKSPSVACIGVTGNLQGKRADLLIADDVESYKNSRTPVQREVILEITKDFTSINSTGRIVYLGTPQTMDSVYLSLPGRGFEVRIWPGRYPSAKQLEHYGEHLAPIIRQRIEADPSLQTGGGLSGEEGKPTDPRLFSEETLVKKELDQGTSYFALQHMLLTALSDANRYPLKTANLVKLRMSAIIGAVYPTTVIRAFGDTVPISVAGKTYKVAIPHSVGEVLAPLQKRVMTIDPAPGGANGDETGWAVGGLLNSNVYLEAVGGIMGGLDLSAMEKLADLAIKYRPEALIIEKNMGHGSFRQLLMPVITRAFQEAGLPCPGFLDDYVTGQKETRIIATLEPVIGRGALIINEAILHDEADSIAHHPVQNRHTFSFLFQLSRLTRDRNSLIHDDRLDAVEALVRHFQAALAVDQKKAIEAIQAAAFARMQKNPLGKPAYALAAGRAPSGFMSRVRKI